MKFKVLVEYEYPIEHKLPVKAEIVLHGDRVVTDKIKWLEQEPRWIPVSERLPKWGEEVLTIDNDGNYEINHIIDDDINEWFYDGVVAWMPLPQPYEPQESEEE